mmetsp:Transcript_1151/g.3613  ORF Transcript_1151/g.3613 Transcript_1151/m.3613 type:complete len:463 (-) Transcript_1151:428-1816(-)
MIAHSAPSRRRGARLVATIGVSALLALGFISQAPSGSWNVLWSMAEVRTGSVDKPYTCNCSWTAAHACPGALIAGSKGYATEDRSLCFYHCCPASCAFWDLAGHCLKNKEPDAVAYEEALKRKDGFMLKNIALGNDCEETWAMTKAATMVTRLIRHGIEHLKMPIQVEHYLPPNTDMRVLTFNGGILVLENVTVTRVTPSTLKYGICYDDYEWWVQQPWYVRLANERPPDRMMVISTDIESEVHFQYELYQDLLVGHVPIGRGSGDLTVQGFLALDVDLSMIGQAAISDCDGAFGFSALSANVETGWWASPLGIDSRNGNTTRRILERFMPLIAKQMNDIICWGDGLAKIHLHNGAGGTDGRFTGLVQEMNVNLEDRLGIVDAVQSTFETDKKRWDKAIRDQQRLQQVGVKTAFGTITSMNRFRNVRYLSPPSPPPPLPSSPPAPPSPPYAPHWLHAFMGGW